MNKRTKLGALLGAAALTLGIVGTTSAVVDYATVTGHLASTAENNQESFWEDFLGGDAECSKLNTGEGDLGDDQSTYVLSQDYELVVVKAGSSSGDDPNSLTLFGDSPSAGQTVWADSNGDGVFNEGDKNISHIVFCNPTETSSESSSESSSETTSETFTSSEEGETELPSEPNTATIGGNTTSGPSNSSWLLVAALGVLLASVLVMAPARSKPRR